MTVLLRALARFYFLALSVLCFSLAGCGGDDGAGGGTNIPTGRGFGEPCDLDVNCRDGLSCLEGMCQPAGDTPEGSPCSITGECAEGLYCSTDSVCATAGDAAVNDGCQTTADCQAGLVCRPQGFALACVEPEGTTDVGGACESPDECLPGLGCFMDICTAGMDTGLPPIWPPPNCTAYTEGPLRMLFEVPRGGDETTEFYSLPFPNDIRLDNGKPDMSGHRAPPLEGYAGPIVEEYLTRIEEELDGFGLNPTIYFRFSGSIDLNSLSQNEEARFTLYDVTADAPEYGESRGLGWAAVSGSGSGGQYICDNWLGMKVPWGRSLLPGHTYAVVLRRGVMGDTGPVEASEDFLAVMGDSTPGDPDLASAWQRYQPLREFLASESIPTDDVIGATVFTTQTNEATVPAVREAVLAEDPPAFEDLTLCDGVESTVSPCDDGLTGEEHVRGCFDVSPAYHEIHGRVSIPTIQQGTAPYLTPEDGGDVMVSNGQVQVQGSEPVCVSMTVPKSVTMPEEGWPLVIYAHGTSGSFQSHAREEVAGLLSQLDWNGTPAGAVVLGFDQVMHGTRTNGSTIPSDQLYFNFTNPRAVRGHLLQGSADLFYLARLAENGWELSESESPTGEAILIDPNRIYLMAHSQGTQYAGLVAAHEDRYGAYVMSGAGGGLLLSLLEKTEPINIAAGVKFALNDINVDEFHPGLNLVQMYFDGVDPINFAEETLPRAAEAERPHWFHVMGVGDSYTPDITQKRYAVGVGAPLVVPAPDADGIGGLNELMLPASGNFGGDTALTRQYEPDDSYDGHFVIFNNETTQGDVAEFFGSLLVDGIPTVQ